MMVSMVSSIKVYNLISDMHHVISENNYCVDMFFFCVIH